ncbi:ABC transporter permease [Pseudonocardia sp. ICBG1293]|uniref:ABC transporter permease n=1 Tax=Pseudonocardia sp. ICBG1293 TaxID=2844382 RepID=UPI001CCE2241|nr:ABC transporter permease [Pseudonocardia sp. ICBG1293]
MMLLVLIFLVIAIALWAAGWILQIVALFWISVGISLLAGLVLLIDWWQSRAAVRAGDQGHVTESEEGSRASVDDGRPGVPGRSGPDMEPVTQVLPVVRPESGGAGSSAPGGSGGAGDETMQIPLVPPSGSDKAPPTVSRSSGCSSRTVTDDEPVDRVADQGDPDGSSGPDATAATADGAVRGAAAAGSGPSVATGDGPTSTDAGPAPASGTDTSDAGAVAAPGFGSGAPERVAGPVDEAIPAGTGTGPGSDDPAVAGPVDGSVGTVGSTAVLGAPGAVQDAGTADRTAAGATATDGAAGGVRADGATVAGAAAEAPAGQAPTGQAPAEQPPTDGDTPEAPRDAALVTRLSDEVLVIDEHPRYHMQTCRALAGRSVIPLPVSEAVELGFTPCAWCSPNHVLGERHPAQAR